MKTEQTFYEQLKKIITNLPETCAEVTIHVKANEGVRITVVQEVFIENGSDSHFDYPVKKYELKEVE